MFRSDTAQHHVRIGHRRFRARAVTCGARIRARALRPHSQKSARIDARDRSAARAHGVNIEHRDADRIAVDRRLRGMARDAVNQAHVGRCAAHIESQHASEPAGARGFQRSHQSARRTGQHRAHRMLPRIASRKEPAVRLHDRYAPSLRRALQLSEIALHQRTDVSIDQRGRASFILANLRADFVRRAKIHALLRQRLRGGPLVCGVLIGV